MGVWRGGSAWRGGDGSLPLSWAGWHCSAMEMTGGFSVPRSKVPPCSGSYTSPCSLLGFPKRHEPGLRHVEYVRSNGIVKLWLSHSIQRIGCNFHLIVFPHFLHLGDNLNDIQIHQSQLVFICWSFCTLERAFLEKSMQFGTSCSLRWCGVATLDIEILGCWKACFLDQYPKLRCRRRLGNEVAWGAWRLGESRAVLAGKQLEKQPKWPALCISGGGGVPGLQGSWPIAWHCWGLLLTGGTSRVCCLF